MSDNSQDSTYSTPEDSTDSDLAVGKRSDGQRSFAERFVDSFFQEKNIRWLLLIGAAIIFGSSLMLVTKAWPEWSATLRAFTVLGYTGSLFAAGHFCRVRLNLSWTYKVLYGLTVLLIPITFLSLSWLSPGSAVQTGLLRTGMAVPFLAATAFLWFASRLIFDHVLRSRQTSFLTSYCVLCMAGALPELSNSVAAFVFLIVAWVVMTVGVVKVNRHIFNLVIDHQLPRMFGFLPITLLGIQFLTVIGILAGPALSVQWMGFGCVLLAATILLTAMSLMNVFQQRTGDLVRPFPWSISVPLIVGLCLTVGGVALSFTGFSYVSDSTFAVIPTALIASGLMFLVGAKTRHSAFVWFGLIFLTIGYQSCPVLFSDLVQSVKESTADAIRRERVPVSMYGLTYVPLLLGLVVAFRKLSTSRAKELAIPFRDYLVILSAGLAALSFQDYVSTFVVAVVNVFLFAAYGIILKERRFGYLSVISGVLAVGVAIPALNGMQYLHISEQWTAVLLSAVAVGLSLSMKPDQLLGRIDTFDRMFLAVIGLLRASNTDRSSNSKTEDDCHVGFRSVPVLRTIGGVLAFFLAIHWMLTVAIDFSEPLTMPETIQFGCLLTAVVVSTLRKPVYVMGMWCHVLCLFFVVRWAIATELSFVTFIELASWTSLALTAMFAVVVRSQWGRDVFRRTMRQRRVFHELILCNAEGALDDEVLKSNRGLRSQIQAFIAPLFDLSSWVLWSLAVFAHLPALILLNCSGLTVAVDPGFTSMLTTPLVLLACGSTAVVCRRHFLSCLCACCVPLMVTAYLPLVGLVPGFADRLLVWLLVDVALVVAMEFVIRKSVPPGFHESIQRLVLWVSTTLMGVSCFVPDLTLNLAALVIGFLMLTSLQKRLGKVIGTLVALICNVQVLAVVLDLFGSDDSVLNLAIPFAWCGASILTLRWAGPLLSRSVCRIWTGLLLSVMVILFGNFCTIAVSGASVVLVFVGLLLAGIYEFLEAIERQDRIHVQAVRGILFAAGFFLVSQAFDLMNGVVLPYVLLGMSVSLLCVEKTIDENSRAAMFRRDLVLLARVFPALISIGVIGLELFGRAKLSEIQAHHSLILMTCAAIYGYLFLQERRPRFAVAGVVLLNLSLDVLWRTFDWTSIEFSMVPAGFSVLMFSRVLRNDLPRAGQRCLQYVGSLTVLLAPMMQILDGSWQHMLALLILSVVIIVMAIGLRIRSLMYCGTGFLMVDLVAMVVQTTSDSPTLLWGVGIVTGIGMMALAAYCERHREQLLARIRHLSGELATWE